LTDNKVSILIAQPLQRRMNKASIMINCTVLHYSAMVWLMNDSLLIFYDVPITFIISTLIIIFTIDYNITVRFRKYSLPKKSKQTEINCKKI